MGYQSNRNYQSSRPPMMEDPDNPPPQGAFPVWSKVFTKPTERTFVEITGHPEAKAKGAYAWIFIAGMLSALITSLTQTIILRQVSPEIAQMMSQLLPGGGPGMFIASLGLLGTLCSAILGGLFSIVGFAIGVSLVQAAASALGGRGTFDKLAYAFGAIAVPTTLISTLLTPLSIIPSATYCTVPLFIALGLYMVILQVTAIKAVHRFGWGQAVIALFLPAIALILLCGILFVGLVILVGPDILRDMQQVVP